MMKAFGQGVNGIAATNGMKLFEYSINMIKNLMSPYEQRGGTLFKNQKDDIMALLKLQKQMVEGSEGAAKFVIAYHYADALRALEPFKLLNNVQVKDEVARLKSAWDGLKLTAEAQERDELLSQFDSRIAKGLMDRVAHAAG